MKPGTPHDPSKTVMETMAAAGRPDAPPAARPEHDDRALVDRARAGDTEAFGMLVERHRDRAYALALRITRSASDAEDVAQEGFVRAWQALPAFRGESSFGTWLHRIVARRALDRAVSLRARRQREAELDDAGEPAAPLAAARDPLLAAKLERLLARLSPPQRAVLTLHYGRDESVEEIAATLGLPENTVKTHLARGRAALRAAWGARTGEED